MMPSTNYYKLGLRQAKQNLLQKRESGQISELRFCKESNETIVLSFKPKFYTLRRDTKNGHREKGCERSTENFKSKF